MYRADFHIDTAVHEFSVIEERSENQEHIERVPVVTKAPGNIGLSHYTVEAETPFKILIDNKKQNTNVLFIVAIGG